jgi:hypothetical protein
MEEWLGQGKEEGDKGAREFGPGWSHQPGPEATNLSWLVAPTGTKGPSTRLAPSRWTRN